MSSHDCRIQGTIQLKNGVTRDQVKAALSEFLEEKCQADFEELVAGEEEITYYDGNILHLNIRFHGYGGFQSDAVDALAKNLAELSEDGEFFELIDDDTADEEAQCMPYFLAAPEKGQLEYGIMAMSDWIRPLVGDERFESIANGIRQAAEEARNAQGASA